MTSKPSPAENAVSVAASLLFLAGIFHNALKLPDFVGTLFILAGGVGMWIWIRMQGIRRRESANAPDAVPKPAVGVVMKRRLIIIGVYAIACAASPFWMQYTGVNLPFSETVIIAVITFIICVSMTLVAGRRQQ
jgi:hypothetical protein